MSRPTLSNSMENGISIKMFSFHCRHAVRWSGKRSREARVTAKRCAVQTKVNFHTYARPTIALRFHSTVGIPCENSIFFGWIQWETLCRNDASHSGGFKFLLINLIPQFCLIEKIYFISCAALWNDFIIMGIAVIWFLDNLNVPARRIKNWMELTWIKHPSVIGIEALSKRLETPGKQQKQIFA